MGRGGGHEYFQGGHVFCPRSKDQLLPIKYVKSHFFRALRDRLYIFQMFITYKVHVLVCDGKVD